ncbi:poly(A)-specific ribonuclease PARN [Silene latifolia]|uniref:poly(A)-specific ribonuclease PARN n=1 Tax=Silene latifolia TaxID=37657 RepID=UPI003D77F8BE
MRKLTKLRPFFLPSFLRRTLTSSSSTTTQSPNSFSLKNVTKSNFDETLIDLTAHVKSADFIAIDLEMTGITRSPWRESFEFDRHDIRYLKVKDSVENFAVVQFGVCPFRWDPSQDSFVAHPHNFFIFPRQELPSDGPLYEFMCQTSSIGFLAKYQFDFNACIREGVSYLSRGQEDAALNRLNSVYENWYHAEEVRDVPLVNMADILFSERMKIRLSEWHSSLLGNKSTTLKLQGNIAGSKQQIETVFFGLRPAIRLSGFTSHQLKLIELVSRKHFKDLVFVRAQEGSVLQKLIVYVESDSDKAKLLKEVKDGLHSQAIKTVEAAVGFRQVIDLLAAEKKLIVGHNCFLDMAHVYHKFFGPLPSTVQDFVSDLHKSFPHIIDTKLLLNADNSLQQLMKKASTSLASAFSIICPEIASERASDIGERPCVKVEVQVDDMRSSNWNSGARHEAGYDAFMTGCVFAQSCTHLGVDFAAGNVAISDNLQNYINLLYLTWNSGDIVNLSTGDITELPAVGPSRRKFQNILHQNVVLIWGFPPTLKAAEIRKCISKVFGIHSVTSIYNLDETSVFLQFSKTELVSEFLALKHRLETTNNSVSVLHSLSKLLEGGKTRAAGYEIYKDICSSSLSKILFTDQAEAVGINWKTKLVETNKISEIGEITKLMADVHKNTSKENVFDQIFYNSSSKSYREMKAIIS